ncbi:hypothetical protein AWN90_41900 [Nocardia terpenica]|uniref:Uncharacterized protein n=1 Tax=Nocardia terpenica TaxID=455432 RepID=A0A164K625_9NOCA|nr:hypothetical protein AWN90_41900 [Nocardia terpenica]
MIAGDGWTELPDEPFDGSVPPIPEWIDVGSRGRAIYEQLARLPQARTYGAGTWLTLHMTLPLIERYLSRPGSENFKAIVATLGSALSLTELDMQRARIRVKPVEDEAEVTASPGEKVVPMAAARRARLMNSAS